MRLDVKPSAKCHLYNTCVYIMRVYNAVISLELAYDDRSKKLKEIYFAAIEVFPVKTKSKPQEESTWH